MNRSDGLIGGLLAAALVALLVPLARLGIDQHHDGIMLKPALDVLAGQVLFRDSFTQYGALTTYLQAMALWFSPSLLSIRLLTVAAYGATLVMLYAGWRLILPRSLAILSCVLFMLFIPAYERDYWNNEYWLFSPWSSVYAMMFQSLGLYALLRMIMGEHPRRWGMLCGIATACVFWCRQPVGIIMAGCLGVIWLALHWTNWTPGTHRKGPVLWSLLGGFLAVNALLLGELYVTGALPQWWYQNIVWPGRWSASMEWRDTLKLSVHPAALLGLVLLLAAIALPGWLKKFLPARASRLVVFYYGGLALVLVWQSPWLLRVTALREGGWGALFPLVVLAQAIVSIIPVFTREKQAKPTEYYLVASLAALSLGSMVQLYPMADSWHIVWALAPTFGLVTYALWRWTGWRAPVLMTVILGLLVPAAYLKARAMMKIVEQPVVTLTSPSALRGMKVPENQARNYRVIVDALAPILKQHPDIPSAMIGNDAIFLCFTNNRTNPSPFYVTWRGLADNEANINRWNYIQTVRPLMFLHKARWEAVDDFYRRARYIPLLYLPEEALEIALPQELADTMGLKPYGASPTGEATKATLSKP
jgi:hypothetical protein